MYLLTFSVDWITPGKLDSFDFKRDFKQQIGLRLVEFSLAHYFIEFFLVRYVAFLFEVFFVVHKVNFIGTITMKSSLTSSWCFMA